MKRLVLIRHGKATWKTGMYEDFKRPLNSRGKIDVEIMSQKVLNKEKPPEALFVSKATRTSETGLIIKFLLRIDDSVLQFENSLYTFEWFELLTFLRKIDNSLNTVWIVGHNPALTELTNYLSWEKKLLNLQTSGVAVLELDISNWSEAHKDCGDIVKYHYPKEFKLPSYD